MGGYTKDDEKYLLKNKLICKYNDENIFVTNFCSKDAINNLTHKRAIKMSRIYIVVVQ